jgi:hypothetical protein
MICFTVLGSDIHVTEFSVPHELLENQITISAAHNYCAGLLCDLIIM